MATMATVSPGFFYKPPLSDRLNERRDSNVSSVSNKSIENPLLDRDPPPLTTTTTETTPTGGGAMFGGGGGGMRQRRGFRDDKENSMLPAPPAGAGSRGGSSSASFSKAAAPPPRASLSLGTAMESMMSSSPAADADHTTHSGMVESIQQSPFVRPSRTYGTHSSSSTELALVPSTTNCWVLVFGYATVDQYEELLHRFSSYGHVLHHRGLCQPGQSNWIAIQYANDLEAKKALCHSTVQLSSSIYCGVIPLADDDPILLQRHDSMASGLFTKQEGRSNNKEQFSASSSNNLPGWTEHDILLHGRRAGSALRENDVCTRVMRWVLGIPSNIE